MTYTPAVLETLANRWKEFPGENRLAIRVTVTDQAAEISLGELELKRPMVKEESPLEVDDFRFKPVYRLPKESFNGVAAKEMVDAELASLGDTAQYLDVMFNDLSSFGSGRRNYLYKIAKVPCAVVATGEKMNELGLRPLVG